MSFQSCHEKTQAKATLAVYLRQLELQETQEWQLLDMCHRDEGEQEFDVSSAARFTELEKTSFNPTGTVEEPFSSNFHSLTDSNVLFLPAATQCNIALFSLFYVPSYPFSV